MISMIGSTIKNITDFTDTFDNACQVLEECQQSSTADVSSLLKTKTASIRNNNSNINNEINNAENHEAFSHLFYNIDGNETYFDKFLCNFVKSIDYDFSVIGLAETNTEKVNKDIYRIDGYTSCTGICLYVHERYNYIELTSISMTTDNLEKLFVKLTDLDEPVIVGVVYRPTSGDANLFQSEFRDVLSSLPADHSVHISIY